MIEVGDRVKQPDGKRIRRVMDVSDDGRHMRLDTPSRTTWYRTEGWKIVLPADVDKEAETISAADVGKLRVEGGEVKIEDNS